MNEFPSSFDGSQPDLIDVVSKSTDVSGAQTPISNSSSMTDVTSDTELPAIMTQGSCPYILKGIKN